MTSLEEIRTRLAAATRGPWSWDGHRVPTLCGRDGDPELYEYDTDVLEVSHDGGCGCRSACTMELTMSPADANLIENAPNDIAFLLQLVEQQARALQDSSRQNQED